MEKARNMGGGNTNKSAKAPKRSLLKRSNKMTTYSSLMSKKSGSKKDKRARQKAEELADLPEHPVARFFARLHPKRVFKFWFSKRGLMTFLKILAALILIGIITIGGMFLYYKKDLEAIRLEELNISDTTNIYLDRNGETLWEDVGDGDYRLVVEGNEISSYMRQATVAIEDKNFYNHPGIDLWALIRAAFATLSGQGVQGGSTLTQQLIKQVYFSDEAKDRGLTGIPRKIKEAILAVEVEKMYDKEQLITMYLNESPYGGRRNGVESGAQTYFGKSAKDLTLAESALLASIPNNPAVLNPYNEYGHEYLIARQHKTLDTMVEMGYISAEEAKEAKEVAILDTVLPETNQYDNIKAPHFVLAVKEYLENKYGVKTMRNGGYTIKTTLDYRAQEMAEQAVANGAALMKSNGSNNIALASVDVETAQVIAMVGSSDWEAPIYGQVNAATALLEPGSTIKPLLDYGPLFMQRSGQNYGPGSILKDENIDSLYCAGYKGTCQLRNYTGGWYGNVTIRQALANSLNIPAVKALYINGVQESLDILHALGDISYCAESNNAGLSSAIGSGCNVKLVEHANAYASIARGGVYRELSYVLEMKNSKGEVVESWEDVEGTRVYDEQVAYMVSDILGDAGARNLVFGAQANAFGFKVPNVWTASKTGTTTTANSSQTKDSLMASYSPVVATVVWNGNHDGSALSNSTNNLVRRVVNDYMDPVHNQLYASEGKWTKNQKVAKPAGIQTLTVNGKTDIWPSWYNSKNSGTSVEKMTFNKLNYKLASECTPADQRIEIEVTKSLDPITRKEIYGIPEPYNRDEVDDCLYTPANVSIKYDGSSLYGHYQATIIRGSVGIRSVSLYVNGSLAVTTQNPTESTVIFDYEPGDSDKTVYAEIIDNNGQKTTSSVLSNPTKKN